MQDEITRRGTVIGVSAIGVASCTTTSSPISTAGDAQNFDKNTGNMAIDALRMGADELVYYAMVGVTIREIVRKHLKAPGRKASHIVNVGFIEDTALPPVTTEKAIGCCFVPVSVSDGGPFGAAASNPQQAYAQLLESIGIQGVKPFGCVKC